MFLVAIDLITKHIARQLDERGFSIRSRLKNITLSNSQIRDSNSLSENIIVLPQTRQLKFSIIVIMLFS